MNMQKRSAGAARFRRAAARLTTAGVTGGVIYVGALLAFGSCGQTDAIDRRGLDRSTAAAEGAAGEHGPWHDRRPAEVSVKPSPILEPPPNDRIAHPPPASPTIR